MDSSVSVSRSLLIIEIFFSEQGLSGKDGETGAAGPSGPAVSIYML